MKKVKHVCRRCGFLSVFAARPVEVVKCARCGEIQGAGQPRALAKSEATHPTPDGCGREGRPCK